MSRYRSYNPEDDQPARDGDAGWVGVNAKATPERLLPGFAQAATNLIFKQGLAETRRGCVSPAFCAFSTMRPVSARPTVLAGAGVFSDPNGLEWMLLATDTGVWRCRVGHTPRRIVTPEPLTSGTIEFVQAFDRVLLFRGSDKIPWVWDGTVTGAFQVVNQETPGDGTVPIPYGSDRDGLRPVLLNSRLIIPHDRTQLAVSEILDYTQYDEAFADFNVTTGNDDTLTGLYPFTGSTVLCFKDQSIAAVSGIAGTLAASLEIINREVGCVAGRTIAMVGGDVFFLSATGVFRLQQIIQDRLQTAPIAVSDPIAPLIARINWAAVGKATAAVVGDYYYLAVPIDGSASNNAIFPYNTVTGAWEGIHNSPLLTYDALVVTDGIAGRRELYAVCYDTQIVGPVVVRLYAGREDIVTGFQSTIVSSLRTRGYLLGENGQKMFRRAEVAVETWNPNFTVTAYTDGVNESRVLGTKTRSRTRYFTFGAPPWVATNANNDHGAARREDYSFTLESAPVPRSGMALDLHQSTQDRFALGRRARWCALEVANTEGSIRIASIEVNGDETERSLRTAT